MTLSFRFRFLLVYLGWLAMLCGTVSAQGLPFQNRAESSAGLITPPRAVRQILSDAQRAIDQQQWSDAVAGLGDFLQQETSEAADLALTQDYFLDSVDQDPNATLSQSLIRQARQMIGDLPADARETYELLYGPSARRIFDQATRQRDWLALAEVRRRYFHTQAGYLSSIVLARRAWQRGEALHCAMLLKDIIPQADASPHIDASVVALFAVAAHQSELSLEPELKLSGPVPAVGDAEAIAAGQSRSGESLRQWCNDAATIGDLASARWRQNFGLMGTTPDRNGGASGQMPLTRPEWVVESTASPRESELLADQAERFRSQGVLLPPSAQPLSIDGQVMVRTTKWLTGIDQSTGKMVWTFPWYSAQDALDDFETPHPSLSEEQEVAQLVQRVWHDLPYGQLSSDGQRLFLLDGLDDLESFRMGNSAMGLRSRREAANTLVALELKTQGKLLWRIGADEDEASTLGDAFFLGPPLPIDGRLYVLAEVSGDLGLYCLDPATGQEIWRQTLGSIDGLPVRFDAQRRLAGAMPTYYQGLLICATGNGLVVAIDLADRTFRWARRYPRPRSAANNSFFDPERNDLESTQRRWADGVAIAGDGHVVITPVESDQLIVLNAATGQSSFRAKPRSGELYVAGIRDGNYILVGRRQVAAYDLDSGKKVWATDDSVFAGDQEVAGRGAFGDGDYLVPTTQQELIRISTADGSITGRKKVDFPLGNLVASGGELFSQTATEVVMASGVSSLQPDVRLRLEQNPDDVMALIDQAQLMLENGQRDQAVDVLHKAEALDSDNDEIDQLLVSAMLEQLRESESIDTDLIAKLEPRIDQPEQMLEFQRLKVDGFLRQGQPEQSLRELLALSAMVLDSPESDGTVVTGSQTVSVHEWIAGRVTRCYRITEDQTNEFSVSEENLDDLVSRTLSEQLARPTAQLQELLRQWSPTGFADQIGQVLFERLKTKRQYHLIERMALGTLPHRRWIELSDDRLYMLAYAYAKSEMPEDASAVIAELANRTAIDRLAEADWAGPLPDLLGQRTAPLDLWPDRVDVSLDLLTRASPTMAMSNFQALQRRFATLRLSSESGRTFSGWEIGTNSSQSLQVRDALGRARPIALSPHPNRNGMREYAISGSLALLSVGTELIALDMTKVNDAMQPPMIWRRELVSRESGVSSVRTENDLGDVIYRNRISSGTMINGMLPEISVGPILGDRFFVFRNGELMCLDAITGDTRWRTTDAPRTGVLVVDGSRVALVSDETNEIRIYDLYDGTLTSQKPWNHGDLWGRSDRFVVAIQADGEDDQNESLRRRVIMVDPLADGSGVMIESDNCVVSRSSQSTEDSFGDLLNGRWVTILNHEGKLVVWDLQSGKELARESIDLSPGHLGLSSVQMRGGLVILPQVSMPASNDIESEKLDGRTTDNQKEAGAALAFDSVTGELKWRQDFELPWGVTLDQPAASPLLLFTRLRSAYSTQGKREQSLDFQAIDVRNGKLIAQQLRNDVGSKFTFRDTEQTLLPHNNIKARIDTLTIDFQFLFESPSNPAGQPDAGDQPSSSDEIDDTTPEQP
ncbi:outer membrane protein assembly factor BamB family protein [Crateriforma conspicua]|uniref:Outer membrane biogenesis protein BamB n=1 Tax=Crateriforma conspicua TaxID=2527996 RepID=A0A5C5Y4E6_9PLAN|nr:PQQ-binding-like beta-propeller repeat protein [Crateriforma conspicua]TWT70044.1 outer membrane biogenesis protein BamB [Crateriforma conspicua]